MIRLMLYKKHRYQTSDSMKVCVNSSDYLPAITNSLEDELMVIDENYRIIKAMTWYW